MIVLCRVSRT